MSSQSNICGEELQMLSYRSKNTVYKLKTGGSVPSKTVKYQMLPNHIYMAMRRRLNGMDNNYLFRYQEFVQNVSKASTTYSKKRLRIDRIGLF